MGTSPVRRVVGGRYELLGLLATGGMGQVWRGRDALLDRPVAVKLLRSEYTEDETVRSRFRTEARLAGRLLHRNIAALHDYGEAVTDDGEVVAHLVMELVDGEPLSALLAREGRLPPDRVLDLVGQTAAALAAAHDAGVVHRDVKPGNVLVGDDGIVRITDFGIAWSAGSAPLTRTGQVVGTAHYLAPEQAAGGKAGPASDVYALGMVAYECLAGRRAFDGEHPVQIALRQIRDEPDPLPDDLPGPVRELVSRMLVKDPAGRLADGAAVCEAVATVRAGRALPPAPTPVTAPLPAAVAAVPPPRPPRRAGRALAGVATLAVGAALGVGVLQVAGPGQTPVTTAEAGPTSADGGVDVRRSSLVGRSADEVEEQLVAAGLRVRRVVVETADAAPGIVTAATPVGRLDPGETVTLTVAAAVPAPSSTPSTSPSPEPDPRPYWPPAWPSAPAGQATEVADALPTTPAPAPAPAPDPAPVPDPAPATPPVDDTPGNGNGNGNANANSNAGGNGRGNGWGRAG
ncbi:serine/threonine-protein kinase [Geodermatophilus normandii]|uniref:non-specific serine/threonine protein kinase n=1 Tax=Geodermatophilus normandii TaxID=1137989 RepID=A0A317QGC8_9ACTN|nr:serine/threonine protein kinase [Geodermatophilus normandii]PWW22119.1 serine/threonine-protein kinase [Geodermatophilus normandii]